MRWLPFLSLLLLLSCSTVNLTPHRELDFPPTTEVEVLQEEPNREHIVLGEMWVNANDNNGVLKMREKAMEIGAHAIILLGERTAGAVAIPLQGAPGGAVAARINRTYALAIRYER